MDFQDWRTFRAGWELGFVAPVCRIRADLMGHLTILRFLAFTFCSSSDMSMEGRKIQAKPFSWVSRKLPDVLSKRMDVCFAPPCGSIGNCASSSYSGLRKPPTVTLPS